MKRHRRAHLAMLAGWLFADLFLVLLIVGLSMMPAKKADPATPPSTTSEPGTHPPGLDPRLLEFEVALSPVDFRAGAQDAFVQLVNTELGRLNPDNRLVGFVLVFASDDSRHIDRAMATAAQAVDVLRARSPVFASAPGLGYWNGPHNNFALKVFLLN